MDENERGERERDGGPIFDKLARMEEEERDLEYVPGTKSKWEKDLRCRGRFGEKSRGQLGSRDRDPRCSSVVRCKVRTALKSAGRRRPIIGGALVFFFSPSLFPQVRK